MITAGALGADLLVGGCGSGPIGCAPYEQMVGEPQPTLDARIHALSSAIIACYNATPGEYRSKDVSAFSAEIDIPFKNGDLMKISADSKAENGDADFANQAIGVTIALLENSGTTVNMALKYSVELNAQRGGMIWQASSDRATGYVKYGTITAGSLDSNEMPSNTAHVEAEPHDGGGTYITDDAATLTCVERELFADAKSLLRATTAGNVTPNIAEPSVTGACVTA